jgi:hypothetical protein
MDAVCQALAARVAELDRQATDLLEANNRLLVRAREAERKRDEAEAVSHDRVAGLTDEIDTLRAQFAREGERARQVVLDTYRAGRVDGLQEAAAKLEWFRPPLSGPDYGAMTDDERRTVRQNDSRLANLAECVRRLIPAPAGRDAIRKTGGAHEVDGYLAGVVIWAGVEHPVMAIPVARGFLLHIYGWAQLARRVLGR